MIKNIYWLLFQREYPGNFNCICEDINKYSNCTKSLTKHETPPQNIYFLFQPLIRLNEEHKFILLIESFGSVESTIEIATSSYVLVNTKVSKDDHKMFKLLTSSQIRNILKTMKLETAEFPSKVLQEKVYMATFSDVLTATGHQTLKLIIKCKSRSCEKTIFHLSYYNAMVIAKDSYCFPTVHLSSCENSFQPRQAALSDFNFFKPTIQRSCNINSSLTYQWSVEHYVNEKTMMNLPNERSSSLQLEPFTLLFDDLDDMFTGFYTIKLIVFEDDHKHQKSGMAIWRVIKSFTFFEIILTFTYIFLIIISVFCQCQRWISKGSHQRWNFEKDSREEKFHPRCHGVERLR